VRGAPANITALSLTSSFDRRRLATERQTLGMMTTMKFILTIGLLLALALLSGCNGTEAGPRFQGRIVSHVDTYGSGTGSESRLHREGSMTSGFDYGDPAKSDWTSDIKWCFLRREGGTDV